jgi:ATP-dependent DNA ligase
MSLPKVFKAFRKASAATGRLEKQAILSKYSKYPELLDLLFISYSKIKFHIHTPKDLPPPVEATEDHPYVDHYNAFLTLLQYLNARKVTGNKARDEIVKFFSGLTEDEQLWYKRAMAHDLNIGVGIKSVYNVFDEKQFLARKDALFPESAKAKGGISFAGAMSCKDYDPEKHDVTGWLAEPKLDGYRLSLVIMPDKQWSFFSRQGHGEPYNTNLTHIAEEWVKATRKFRKAGDVTVTIDGEILHKKSWNDTGVIKRKKLSDEDKADITKNIRFNVFDMLLSGNEHSLSARKQSLESLASEHSSTLVSSKIIKGITCQSVDEIDLYYQQQLAKGHEGLILKDPDGTYQHAKRSASWLKLKPVKTMDVQVLNLEPGEPDTKNANRLGRVKVKDANGTKFYVGGGFSDEERDKFWANPDLIKHQWIEIKLQDDGANCTAKSRFARFIRLREDLKP